MDREYIIRLILQARDMASGVMRRGTQDMAQDLEKVKDKLEDVTEAQEKNEKSSDHLNQRWNKFRQGARDLSKTLDEVRDGVRKLDSELKQHSATTDGATRSNTMLGNALNRLGGVMSASKKTTAELKDEWGKLQGTLTKGERAAKDAEQGLTRLGRAAGRAWSNFANLNEIGLIIFGTMGALITLLGQLATALFAIGSSAVYAAGALGGVLLAAISQLIPVMLLWHAVMSRLRLVMRAVGLESKTQAQAHQQAAQKAHEHQQATERLADAQYNLKQAYEAQAEAARRVKDAETALHEARKQAARDVVDSANAKIDARLSERSAVLSLLEAEQRLKKFETDDANGAAMLRDRQGALREAQARLTAATSSGNQGDIESAKIGVQIARENLRGVSSQTAEQKIEHRRAILDVDQARQGVVEAKITTRRAIQDDAEVARKGVENSKLVITARRELRDANKGLLSSEHNILIAHRAVRDALWELKHANDATQGAVSQLDQIMGKLDPTEKNLVKIIQHFKTLFREATKPMTDTVLGSIGKALETIGTLFKDPQLKAAFQNLAEAFGKFIEGFAKFLASPGQKKFFADTINEAAANMPKFLKFWESLLTLIEKIVKAAMPLFENLTGRFTNWFDRRAKAGDVPAVGVRPRSDGTMPTQREANFQFMGQMLDLWIKWWGAFAHLLGTLGKLAAPALIKSTDSMADVFNKLADKLSANGPAVTKFFDETFHSLGLFLTLIGHLFMVFIKNANSKEFDRAINLLDKVAIPALSNVVGLFLKMLTVLEAIASIPGMAKILELMATVFLAMKLVPGVGLASKGAGKILEKTGVLNAIPGWEKLFGSNRRGQSKSDPLYVEEVNRMAPKGGGIVHQIEGATPGISGGVGVGLGSRLGARIAVGAGGILSGLAAPEVIVTTLALLGLAAAIITLRDNFLGVTGALEKFTRMLVLKPLHRAFKDLADLADLVWKPLRKLIDLITLGHADAIGKALQKMGDGFHWAAKHLRVFIDVIGLLALGPLIFLFGQLAGVIWISEKSLRGIVIAAQFVSKWMGKIGHAIFEGLIWGFKKIGDFFKVIGTWLYDHMIKPILDFFGIASPSKYMINIGKDIALGLLQGFIDTIKFFFIGFPTWAFQHIIKPIVSWVGGIAGNVGGALWNVGKSIADAILNGLGSLAGGIIKKIKGVPGAVKNALSGAASALGGLLSGGGDHKHKLPRHTNVVSNTGQTVPSEALYSYFDILVPLLGAKKAADQTRKFFSWVIGIKEDQFENEGQWYAEGGVVKKRPPKHKGLRSRRLPNMWEWKDVAPGWKDGNPVPGAPVPRPEFASGGTVGGYGTAVPIIAHVGEWVLNAMQQSKLAAAMGKPPGWIKEFLFGKGPNPGGLGSGYVPMSRGPMTAARQTVGRLLNRMAGYFGPAIEDWADDTYGMAVGPPGSNPVFLDTPLGEEVQIDRQSAERIVRSKGFWVPEYVKRAPGFANATRAQIEAWKRSNILANIHQSGMFNNRHAMPQPGALAGYLATIMRSPLWSYGSGGVAGFEPTRMPSFAAGGVITTPAAMPKTSAAQGVNQMFQIKTSSPNIDIDYIMRAARIHAEGAF